MNSKQIFGLALGLQTPWHITDIRLEETEGKKSLHVEIGYENGHFVDESGKSTVHDRIQRKWRHLNFFEHECYLHCKVPRIRKDATSKVTQVEVPWSRAGSGFTLLFEAYSMCLIENEMPVNKVGKILEEYPNRIWTIFNYWTSIANTEADHGGITSLGIDETSSKKGHKYVTVAVDMETSRVVHATEGKGGETIGEIAEYPESKGSPRESIAQVCIDLSLAFIRGVSTFDDFWEMNAPEEAEAFLAYWCDIAKESKINPFIKFTNTVNLHWSGIINYTQSRISNGILEGTNGKIQLAKRRVRGFGNTQDFINMIYLISGKLKFNYSHYST